MTKSPVSQDRVGRHPLHPLIAHLPVGLWVGSLVFDMLYFATHRPAFSAAAYYTIALGIICAILSIPPGLIEYSFLPRSAPVRNTALLHLIFSIIALAIYVPNFTIREGVNGGAGTSTPAICFALSSLAVVFLLVATYLGGKLVYQYGMGFRPENRVIDEDEESPEQAA